MAHVEEATGRARRPVRQWSTLPERKRVLVVVQTVVYGQRLLDVIRLLESDLRIQVAFTVAPHTLGEGASRFVNGLGSPELPWEEAVRSEFDLALTAGSQGMDRLRAPVVRLPHGASHIKLAQPPDSGGGARGGPRAAVSNGLSRDSLTRGGRVVPAAVVLAHEEDRARLARSCPEALPVAQVVGDPCHDRIVAGLPHRERYRRALGLKPGQKLVVVTSTWGTGSSFGSIESLLPRLLGELPRRRYRTAVLVHPNVWARHGAWQMRAWLAGCRRRGIALVAPEEDWRAVLIAADVIIGDHGSVTLYGTLTGAPILLARFPQHEVNPATPAAALATTAPALSPAHPLVDQLEYATAEYRSEDYSVIASRITSQPGRFNRNMRRLMYRMLGIGQPAWVPPTEPVPWPGPLDGSGTPGTPGAPTTGVSV